MANGQYNKQVPRASGEAEQKISEAEGYALKRINEAEGDAAKFNALFSEYSKAPEVTKKRLYLESMERVLPMLGGKIVIDDNVKGVLPLMSLDQKLAK